MDIFDQTLGQFAAENGNFNDTLEHFLATATVADTFDKTLT